MIDIDGSKGGGQMLRSALSMSAISGEGFRMENVRGSRPNPGLKRQHLEAVRAVARLTGAKIEGLEEGSEILEFIPGDLEPESFTVNIGTAGSVTLLLDAVLPLTTQFNSGFRLDVKGGTDVKWSPTVEYYRQVKLPLLREHGMQASLGLGKTGFYPSGGGHVRLETGPYSMEPVEIDSIGRLERFEIFSKASEDLRDREVADRQAGELARKLKNSHISVPVERRKEYVETGSTGSSLVLKACYEESIAGFDALGERGKRAEKVSEEVYRDFRSFHSSDAAVDSHMADQLVVFMAIAGGKVSIPGVTDHVQTCMAVMERFGEEFEVGTEKGRKVLRKVT